MIFWITDFNRFRHFSNSTTASSDDNRDQLTPGKLIENVVGSNCCRVSSKGIIGLHVYRHTVRQTRVRSQTHPSGNFPFSEPEEKTTNVAKFFDFSKLIARKTSGSNPSSRSQFYYDSTQVGKIIFISERLPY